LPGASLTLLVDSAVAVAVAAIAISAATAVLAPALRHVWQQRELASTLHGASNLALVAAARAGDPARANLAAIGNEPPQSGNILVVNLLDLVTAVRARLAPTR
jgi:hypothetical protein